MPVKVVDASAIAALLFAEPEADAIVSALADSRLVAPRLLPFELANVCLIKRRRHPRQRAALLAAFRLYDRLGVQEIAVDHHAAMKLAERSGLTAHDASYLWLARELRAGLVTLDAELSKAEAAAPE